MFSVFSESGYCCSKPSRISLPREQKVHELPENERICPGCGGSIIF